MHLLRVRYWHSLPHNFGPQVPRWSPGDLLPPHQELTKGLCWAPPPVGGMSVVKGVALAARCISALALICFVRWTG